VCSHSSALRAEDTSFEALSVRVEEKLIGRLLPRSFGLLGDVSEQFAFESTVNPYSADSNLVSVNSLLAGPKLRCCCCRRCPPAQFFFKVPNLLLSAQLFVHSDRFFK
jgi:hypothetical protein